MDRSIYRQMGSFTKLALAKLYYPECSDSAALHGLRRQITGCPRLLAMLEEAGYKDGSNSPKLTPRQIQIIVDYLGEP